MEISEETYDSIIKLKDNDDIFEKTLELLDVIKKKYKDISNLNDEKVFKTEIGVTFRLLHHIFTSDDIFDSDDDEEDIEKMNQLVFHLKRVIDGINNFDLKNPKQETTSSLNYIIQYFEEVGKHQESFNKSLESIENKMDSLLKTLNDKTKLDEISQVLIKKDLSEEDIKFIQESRTWCQLRLKDYDKDLVLEVMKNRDLETPVDYSKNIKEVMGTDASIEEKQRLNNLINIDLTLVMLLSLESRIKLNQEINKSDPVDVEPPVPPKT